MSLTLRWCVLRARMARRVEIASQVIVAWQKLRCYNGIMMRKAVQSLTDEQLLHDMTGAAAAERNAAAWLIALLAEMDVRRLYLAQGYSSLFVYCTRSLHLSEHAAYGRIEAARAARKFPVILDLLTDGSITLTTVCLLASHLTAENHRRGWSRRRQTAYRYGELMSQCRSAFLVVAVILNTACEDRSALASFDRCISGAVATVRSGARRVDVECQLHDDLFLVGIPGRNVTVDELLRAGVSTEIAQALSQSDLIGNRWCAIQQVDSPSPSPKDRDRDVLRDKTECATTAVEIPEIVQSHAKTVALTLIRSSSGGARLADFNGRAVHGQ